MRSKNKMTRERNRVCNAEKALSEKKVLFFAKDQQVSSRILAVLSVGISKEKVQVTKREEYQTETMVYSKKDNKRHAKIVTKYRRVPTNTYNKIEKYQIICGSNGKIGTWYNTCELDSNNQVKFTKNISEKLTYDEFVTLFPKQCSAFQKIFAEEFTKAKEISNEHN